VCSSFVFAQELAQDLSVPESLLAIYDLLVEVRLWDDDQLLYKTQRNKSMISEEDFFSNIEKDSS